MAYQERTTRSYGSRVSNSLKGVLIGFAMFIGGTALLWWNEGNFVRTSDMLKEAQKVAIHVDDMSNVNSELNGKLIHASAMTETNDVLADTRFNIRMPAVKLIRRVEFYQWDEESHTETRDNIGGGEETITTYTYHKRWSKKPINSENFHDPSYRGENHTIIQDNDKQVMAEHVSFGGYRLTKDLIAQMNNEEPLLLENNQGRISSISQEQTTVEGNTVYFGRNPSSPQVGDVRVTFTKVMPGPVSIISKVNGDTFEPFVAKNGKQLSRLTTGEVSMENMFANEHAANKMLTWLLRLAGILLVIFGLKNIFDIVVILLKVLPFLSNIANLGIGLVCGVIGAVWSLLVIAIAWLFYRPLIGIALLAVIVGIIFFFSSKGKKIAEA